MPAQHRLALQRGVRSEHVITSAASHLANDAHYSPDCCPQNDLNSGHCCLIPALPGVLLSKLRVIINPQSAPAIVVHLALVPIAGAGIFSVITHAAKIKYRRPGLASALIRGVGAACHVPPP